jgi:hypothetical protein
VNQGVERGGALREFLSRIEGEQRHIASLRLGDLAADNRTFLVLCQVGEFKNLSFGGSGHIFFFLRL